MKQRQRIISFLLTFAMLMCICPSVARALETVNIKPTADSKVEFPKTNFGSRELLDCWNHTTSTSYSDRSFIYMSFDVAGASKNKTIESAKLKLYIKTNPASANFTLGFWNVENPWSESEINWVDQPIEISAAANYYPATPADLSVRVGSVSTTEFELKEFDITELVNKYVKSGNINDFSVLIIPKGDYYYGTTYIPSRENSDSSLHPVLELSMSPASEDIEPIAKALEIECGNIMIDSADIHNSTAITDAVKANISSVRVLWSNSETTTVSVDECDFVVDTFKKTVTVTYNELSAVVHYEVESNDGDSLVITACADSMVTGSTDANKNFGGSDVLNMWNHTSTMSNGDRSFAYMAFKIPSLQSAESVISAQLKFYAKNSSVSSNFKMDFWNVYDKWEENTITWINQPTDINGVGDTPAQSYYPTGAADISSKLGAISSDSFEEIAIDITELVKNYVGSKSENDFSVMAVPCGEYYYGITYLITKEYADSSMHPRIELELDGYEPPAVEHMEFVSANLSDDEKSLIITYNNDINVSSVSNSNVTITDKSGKNLSVEKVDVSGKTLTVNAAFETRQQYTVSIEGVSDCYGSVASKLQFTFETSAKAPSVKDDDIVIGVYGDAKVVASTSATENFGSDAESALWNKPSSKSIGDREFHYMAFDIPNLPDGKGIDTATLTLYARHSNDSSVKLSFWNVYKSWNEKTITWTTQPLVISGEKDSAFETNYPEGNADLVFGAGRINTETYKKIEVDVTELVEKYMSANKEPGSEFSFLIAPTGEYLFGITYIATKENSDTSVHPQLKITTKDVNEMTMVSSKPSSDTASFTLTFSNTVAASSVEPSDFVIKAMDSSVVEIKDTDISIDGKTITVTPKLSSYEYYTVVVGDIYDIYNQKANEHTFGFETKALDAAVSFGAVSSMPQKNETVSDYSISTEITLDTELLGEYANEDYIKLFCVESGKNIEAEINYDASSKKITINPDDELPAGSEYRVILKAGIKDTSGNVISVDKTVLMFKTVTAISIKEFKFTYERTPVYDSAEEISEYGANTSVTAVTQITNSSSVPQNAALIIVLYDEDGAMISADIDGGVGCASPGTTTQFSKEINVDSDVKGSYIKAFVWNNTDTIRPLCGIATINQIK